MDVFLLLYVLLLPIRKLFYFLIYHELSQARHLSIWSKAILCFNWFHLYTLEPLMKTTRTSWYPIERTLYTEQKARVIEEKKIRFLVGFFFLTFLVIKIYSTFLHGAREFQAQINSDLKLLLSQNSVFTKEKLAKYWEKKIEIKIYNILEKYTRT